jgi:hypothetical protein
MSNQPNTITKIANGIAFCRRASPMRSRDVQGQPVSGGRPRCLPPSRKPILT